MPNKSATVNVRVQQNVKEQAESILNQLGISASSFIDMAYRQVIMHKGIPFDVVIPATFATRDAMTDAEFDSMMQAGLSQAKNNESIPYEKAFDSLLRGL